MPDLSLKVTPVFGESKYSNTLIHDFLEARIRDELKVTLKIFSNRILHFEYSSEWLYFHQWMINYYHSLMIGLSMSCK
jgi:hypothetical protein